MSSKTKQHDNAFKEEAIRYAEARPELTQEECAGNFEVGPSTHSRWRKNLESRWRSPILGQRELRQRGD